MKRHGKEHMRVNKEVHFGFCSFSTVDSTARSPPSISFTPFLYLLTFSNKLKEKCSVK